MSVVGQKFYHEEYISTELASSVPFLDPNTHYYTLTCLKFLDKESFKIEITKNQISKWDYMVE